MLFLYDTEKKEETQPEEKEKEKEIQLDKVDAELAAKEGWIRRDRDVKYCQHGPHGECTRCMPLPVCCLLFCCIFFSFCFFFIVFFFCYVYCSFLFWFVRVCSVIVLFFLLIVFSLGNW
jgi:hypothetical protein